MLVFDIKSLNAEQKFALFYGIMLGDGCLSHYTANRNSGKMRELFTICVTGSAQDDRVFFEEVLVPLLKSFGRKSVTIKEREYCGAIEINFPDKILFDRIKSYGFPVGKKGSNISIPEYFRNKNLMKFIVAGFMATDGSLVLTKNPNKYYPRIEANSISKILLEQIHSFMISVGMEGHFYLAKRKNNNSPYNAQQQYRIQFNGHKNLFFS